MKRGFAEQFAVRGVRPQQMAEASRPGAGDSVEW